MQNLGPTHTHLRNGNPQFNKISGWFVHMLDSGSTTLERSSGLEAWMGITEKGKARVQPTVPGSVSRSDQATGAENRQEEARKLQGMRGKYWAHG